MEPRSGSGEEVYGRLESWADEGEVPRTPVQLAPDLWRVIQQMDGSLKAHSGSSIADACCGVMVLACNTCGHRNQMIYDFGDFLGAHPTKGCSQNPSVGTYVPFSIRNPLIFDGSMTRFLVE